MTRSLRRSIAVAILVLCAACTPTPHVTDEQKIAAEVMAADTRVVSASAEKSVDGFSWRWTVDVVLSGGEPVTSDELRALLLAARDAPKKEPGHLNLFATGEDGAAIDLTTAGDSLGLQYINIGSGLGVSTFLLDDALNAGE